MSDGITDAYRKIEETPKDKMELNLRMLKYHHREFGKIIEEIERDNKNIAEFQ